MSKPKPAPLPPGTVVGGYQVIKKLAAGGFGVVYLAEDQDKRLVALKEYLPSSLAERAAGELTPRVKPEKQPLYRLVQIHSSGSKPSDASVAVAYRGHWFWIDDRDLRSKRAFAFMLMLFTLSDTGRRKDRR